MERFKFSVSYEPGFLCCGELSCLQVSLMGNKTGILIQNWGMLSYPFRHLSQKWSENLR